MAGETDVLAGRRFETDELEHALTRCREGSGSLCLISGEPGIGKSRLVEWLADRAAEAQMQVAWGFAWEAGGAPPYWPWVQVLRELLGDPGQAADMMGRLGPSGRLLAGLLPELEGAADSVQQDAPDLEPRHAGFQLMDAVARALQLAAGLCPLVVILEDLHAADPSSLQVLDFVARQLRTMPVLVVGTHRDAAAELEERSPLIWKASRGALTLPLARLEAPAISNTVEQVCGARPSEALVERLLSITDGNPLHLAEMVNVIRLQGGPEACEGADLSIPESLRSAIRERLDRLSQPTREQLETASVFGREFDVTDLADLAETPSDDVLLHLDEARSGGLVETRGGGRWRFVHMVTREAVLSGLDPPTRRRRHRRRAQQLSERPEPPWSEIAWHLDAAGVEHQAQAADAWRRAGQRAAASFAFEDAADALERALVILDAVSEADPASRLALLLDVAAVQISAGRAEAGRTTCRRAAELARVLDSPEDLAAAALTWGRVFVYASRDAELIRLLQEALDRLDPGRLRLRALLTARLAAARQPSVPPEEPFELAREAIALARKVDDPRTLLETISSACSALMDLADPVERLELNREHVRLAERLGDPVVAFRAHLRSVIDTLELGWVAELEQALAAAHAVAERTELPHHRWMVCAARAMCDTMHGRFDAAAAGIEAALAAARRTGDPNSKRCLSLQSIALARAQERHGAVVEACEEMLRSESAEPSASAWLPSTLGGMLARTEIDPARLPRIDEATERRILSLGDRSALCGLAEMAVRAEDRARAERVEPRLRQFSAYHAHHGLTGLSWDGPVSRCLALLAELLGRPDDADHWFAQAAEAIDAVGAGPMAARLAYEQARVLLRRGAIEAGLERLEQARDRAEALALDGLSDLINRVDRGPEPKVQPAAESRLRLDRQGELWRCDTGRTSFSLKDTKGVRFLAHLLDRPGVEIHVLELVAEVEGRAEVDTGDAGEVLDERAKTAYRRRLEELQNELAEAESWNDAGRTERLRDEIELLQGELVRAFGLGGRARRAGSAGERARVNVQRRLRDAVKRIAAHDPEAGRELEAALRTGTFCCYGAEP